jgi:hypothetical protein
MMTPGYAKPRSELPWLPYRETDKVFVINSHNFGAGAFDPSVNGKDPIAAWIPTRSQSADDLVGSNDGTLTNGASIVADTGAGGAYAFSFDGVNDHVLLANFGSVTSWSIAAWVKQTSASDYPSPVAITFGSSTNNGIVGRLGSYRMLRSNTMLNVQGAFATVLGDWVHLVAVWDGTAGTLYANGTARTGAVNDSLWSVSGSRIGDGNGSTKFPGLVDDVRIWDQVLGATDIADLHAAQRGGNA